MILSSHEIVRQKELGKISIDPWDESRLNPNSYNLRLHDELLVYEEEVLDMKKDNPYATIKIPKEGLLLKPGKLYLGRTVEFTKTKGLVPMLEGRSSIGRLGMSIHVTAGFGDNGFEGYWTLEITVEQPLIIYPFVEVCQIYYHKTDERFGQTFYKGKYDNNNGIQTSKLFEELNK